MLSSFSPFPVYFFIFRFWLKLFWLRKKYSMRFHWILLSYTDSNEPITVNEVLAIVNDLLLVSFMVWSVWNGFCRLVRVARVVFSRQGRWGTLSFFSRPSLYFIILCVCGCVGFLSSHRIASSSRDIIAVKCRAVPKQKGIQRRLLDTGVTVWQTTRPWLFLDFT